MNGILLRLLPSMSENFDTLFSPAHSEALTPGERAEGWQGIRDFMQGNALDDADIAAFFAPAESVRLSWAEKRAVMDALLPQELPVARSVKDFTVSRLRSFFSLGWAAPVIAAFLLLVGGAGLSYADQALPGDLLYPLKRVDEEIRQSLHFSQESKAEGDAQAMDTRLDEAQAMQVHQSFTQSASAVLDQDFRRERHQALSRIRELQTEGDREAANKLRARLNASADRYQRLFKGMRLDDTDSVASGDGSDGLPSATVNAQQGSD